MNIERYIVISIMKVKLNIRERSIIVCIRVTSDVNPKLTKMNLS